MANESIKGLRDFYTTIKQSGLRVQHQFALEFGGPNVPTTISQFVPIYAVSAGLPGRSVLKEEVKYFGFPFQVPTNAAYKQTWECTVRADINMEVRKSFETWMNMYADLEKNTGGYKGIVPSGDYALIHLLSAQYFNSSIDQGASNGTISRTYRLEGIYPSEIGDMPQSHDNNTIVQFPMVFSFQYWYPLDQTDPLG